MSNFTDVQRDAMVAGYNPEANQAERDAQVANLATEFETKVPNVRGVLVAREVYVAKVKPRAAGAVHKDDLVAFVRIMVGAQDGQLDTLVKATKSDLEVLAQCLRELNDAQDAES